MNYLNYKYLVDPLDGGEAVGDGEGGPAHLGSVQRFLHNLEKINLALR